MTFLRVAIKVLLLLAAVGVQATDFYSAAGVEHIAYKNYVNFSSMCPADMRMINMLPQYISTLLIAHNSKRNELAGGTMWNLKPAKNMATVQWDPELATLAEYVMKTCDDGPFCYSTKYYKDPAVVGIKVTMLASQSDNAFLEKSIDALWSRAGQYGCVEINKGYHCHSVFSNLANERNDAFGCAAAQYPHDFLFNNFVFFCVNGRRHLEDTPVYETGAPASGCDTGVNPMYENLCSADETYAEFNFFSFLKSLFKF